MALQAIRDDRGNILLRDDGTAVCVNQTIVDPIDESTWRAAGWDRDGHGDAAVLAVSEDGRQLAYFTVEEIGLRWAPEVEF